METINGKSKKLTREEIQKLNHIIKSVCKISFQNEDNYITGTGFLIKLFIKKNPFYYLMTNSFIITNEAIESQKEIEICYDCGNKKSSIILDDQEREIQEFNVNNLDIIIVQIIEQDNISENYFLLPYLNYNSIEDKRIYIPQFQKGKDLHYSEGEITKIENYQFAYNSSSLQNSSGSPIILKSEMKVIGIIKQRNESNGENEGNFIYPVTNIINDIIIYNKEQYEGEYVDDKFEGKGKYTYEDGRYYIGEWKKGLRNGKGTMYYKNGSIQYIGEFKKGLFNGKGIIYYKRKC